jgi:hypothetical protein
MTALPNLAGRIFGVPLMITLDAAAVIVAVLGDRLGVDSIAIGGSTMDLATARARGRDRTPREYETSDGVAVLPIMGSLVSRGMGVRPASGLTGYQEIGAAFGQAMADPDVLGIMLEVDSPGGESSLALETARHLASFRGQKPVWAVVSPQAASAAYGLASAADAGPCRAGPGRPLLGVDQCAARPQAVQRRRRGGGQQARAGRVGDAEPERDLPRRHGLSRSSGVPGTGAGEADPPGTGVRPSSRSFQELRGLHSR